jgi:hypothetical protein
MTSENMALEREFQFYLDNQNSLVSQYNGRFVVIKDCKVIGVYEDELEAVKQTSQHHELGTFLVQKCEAGSENYTQTFHSRASFT